MSDSLSPPLFEVDFDYTRADLDGAIAAHRPPTPRNTPGLPPPTAGFRSLLPWFIVGLVATMFMLLIDREPGRAANLPERRLFLDVAIPMLTIALLGVALLFSRALDTTYGRAKALAQALTGLAVIVFVIAVLIWLEHAGRRGPASPGLPPPGYVSWSETSSPHIAWILLMVALFGLLLRTQALHREWNWIAPSFHRRHTLQVTADGITLGDPVSRLDFKWLAFMRVVQTDDMLLLYTGPLLFHFIPRRVLTPEQWQQLSALAREQIEHRPQAFPVLPRVSGTNPTA